MATRQGRTVPLVRRLPAGVAVAVAMSALVASAARAAPPAACDVQRIALVDVPGYVPTEPEGLENLMAAFAVSENVTMRAWQVDGGGGALLVMLLDGETREEAVAARGSLIEGLVARAGSEPAPLALPAGRGGVEGVRVDFQGLTLRAVSTTQGRLIVGVVTAITSELDLGELEVAILLDVLDTQMARVPDDCSIDAPRAAVSSAEQLGVVVGAAGSMGLVLWGAPTLLAWLRDPTARRQRVSGSPPNVSSGFVPHDVTADARRRLSRSRAATAGLLVGIGLAAFSTIAYTRSNRWFLLFIPAGLVVGTVTSRLIAFATGTAAPGSGSPRWLRRGRRRPLAALALALSWMFIAVGILAMSHRLWIATLSENQRLVFAALAGVDEAIYTNVGLVIAAVAFVLAGVSHRLARWLGQRKARDLLARDERGPVLLLRSFQDDSVTLRIRARRLAMTELVHLKRRERLEELLAWTLTDVGPVTTIADPHGRRTPIGAARERIEHREWLPIVAQRIGSAALIVVVIGSTEGLLDELQEIRVRGRLDRTLFVIPPAVSGAAQRWAQVATVFGLASHLDDGDLRTAVIRVDAANRPHAYFGPRRDAPTYQAAIAAAMLPGAHDQAAPAGAVWAPPVM